VDLFDIQELLGHRNIKTTRTHYVAPIVKRRAQAAKRIEYRFGYSALKLPRVPRCGAKIAGDNPPQSAKSGANPHTSHPRKPGTNNGRFANY